MSDMITLAPNQSISDHAKESLKKLTEILNLTSIMETREPNRIRFSVKVDLCKSNFEYIIRHIRESIEALDDLTVELEDDLREERREHERDIECIRKYGVQSVDAEKLFEQLNEDCEHFRLLAISRNKELEQERERSNQLEKRCFELLKELEDAELNRDANLKLYKEEHERYMKLREAKEQSPAYWKANFERMQKKSNQLEAQVKELQPKYDELEKRCKYLAYRLKKVNNPANFCGNCKHFVTHPNDVGTCNNKWAKPFIVDPDDASCPHFESNQVDRDKPDHPCCEACNRDDCDDCTLCPF
jgi:DNA repair exonuclease SbcCD ATPase subunit